MAQLKNFRLRKVAGKRAESGFGFPGSAYFLCLLRLRRVVGEERAVPFYAKVQLPENQEGIS